MSLKNLESSAPQRLYVRIVGLILSAYLGQNVARKMSTKNKAITSLLFTVLFAFCAWLWLDLSENHSSWREATFGVGGQGYLFRGIILWALIGLAVICLHKAILSAVNWLAPRKEFLGVYYYRLMGFALLIFFSVFVLFVSSMWSGMGYKEGAGLFLSGLVWLSAKFTLGLWFVLIPIIALISIGTASLRKAED